MADLLFTFSGRIGRLGYLLSLICMAVSITLIFMLQRAMGDWKFGSIFIIAAAVLPMIIYLSGTSKRFQDRSRHPLFGFLFYYIAPAILVFGVHQAMGDALMPIPDIAGRLADVKNMETVPQNLIVQLAAYSVAALLFSFGQISLFLRNGTAAINVFDET